MSLVTLPARPAAVDLDLDRTAIIVIDMQNDFGSEGGMFHGAGLDISPIKALVPRISAVLADVRAAGLLVVYTKQQHAEDLSDAGGPAAPHFIKHQRFNLGAATIAPDGSDSRVLVRNTWNTEIVTELTPEPGDLVVGKHRFSAFFETDLDAQLRAAGITTLVFTGATTSVCVESTVRDAMFRDYTCVVLADCVTELIAHDAPRSNHDATLLTIEVLLGWIAQSDDFRLSLAARRAAAE